MPEARHELLQSNSPSDLAEWQRAEDSALSALQRIDTSSLAQTPRWVTYNALREALEASRDYRVCQEPLWHVHDALYMTDLAETQPVGTDLRRKEAMSRWRNFPRYIRQVTANLQEGIRRGYTAPKLVASDALRDIDVLLRLDASDNALFSPARRDSSESFRRLYTALVRDSIVPALREHRAFLARYVEEHARKDPRITALPNGKQCYAAAIRRITTLAIPPESLVDRGERLLAELNMRLSKAATSASGVANPDSAMQRLRGLPTSSFTQRDEVLPHLQAIVSRAQVGVRESFTFPVDDSVVIEAVPAHAETTLGRLQYYPEAKASGSPARVEISLYRATRPGVRVAYEGMMFHEAVPGHHLQAVAPRRQLHPVHASFWVSAFSEGWAHYAERLADELGLVPSEAVRFRLLWGQRQLLGFLIVDPSFHALGWSLDSAVRWRVRELGSTPVQAEEAAVRSGGAWLIGQPLAYMVGAQEILRLRTIARAELGSMFSLPDFHRVVLEDGPVPLSVLEPKIRQWIREAKRAQ